MKRIELDSIVFDAGTQIRQSINQDVVAEYAERMTEGVQFPAVVVFSDGTCREDGTLNYYLADGFHRTQAAKRNDFREIEAIVHVGTQQDALWFALAANKANGLRLSKADKKHAVIMAVQAFMETKTQTQIAEQIGCSQGFVSQVISANNLTRPERVTGKDGKNYPASHSKTPKPSSDLHPKHDEIVAALKSGGATRAIAKRCQVPEAIVASVKRALGLFGVEKSRQAVAERKDRMRQMAADGYTSRQIAKSLGLSEVGCRVILRKEKIDVPADRVTGRSKRHDSNRVIEQIVIAAENLTAGAELIDYEALDRGKLSSWIESLTRSRQALSSFIVQLKQESKRHEAA